MSVPKVILLDAVGTLFGVRGSVGDVYGELASQAGVEVDVEALDRAFYESFKAAPPCAFPGIDPLDLPSYEYEWWRSIATQTFQTIGAIDRFPDFEEFFAELYHYFATAEPWVVYEDVLPALRYWQQQGIELGVVSNFDTRLYPVLEQLQLAPFLTSITISSEVGAAKPEPAIFSAALGKHNCEPTEAWHIGDSDLEDYRGAKAFGLRGIWIDRSLSNK
ncbi:MAG TPA: HAD family hydrolase [Oscillatoriales cyanobacterium M59_W2019_021]|nr:HAD family hydrolase [Oscillatoriales cyanobacterium M4454_W2019_049]HIK52271.1 HAD family hydrolase [Oscillatoriales cyanobacterium M59_W2019_021]